MNEKQLDSELLPYPLPPWRHRFRTLSIFCEVDEAALLPRVPAPLELASNVVQITVMHFESTVPTRPYYDSAVIAQVRYGSEVGGHWVHAFTSTDQVCAGTRELWGFRMKLASMELHVDANRIWGFTERLGRRVIEIDMQPTGREFEPLKTFPRLFREGAAEEADRADAISASSARASSGNQVLPWGSCSCRRPRSLLQYRYPRLRDHDREPYRTEMVCITSGRSSPPQSHRFHLAQCNSDSRST